MRQHLRLALAAVLAGALAIAGCGGTGPAPSGTAIVQVRVCGPLDGAICADAVAAVTHQIPVTARASVAVVAPREADALVRRGGDLVLLVAFSRDAFVGQDLWLGTPTWVVTMGAPGGAPSVEPWRETRLPAGFVTLLRSAGIPA
jgi:hypothetical protein